MAHGQSGIGPGGRGVRHRRTPQAGVSHDAFELLILTEPRDAHGRKQVAAGSWPGQTYWAGEARRAYEIRYDAGKPGCEFEAIGAVRCGIAQEILCLFQKAAGMRGGVAVGSKLA